LGRWVTTSYPLSNQVGDASVSTSRTAPLAASATRNVARLWSRGVLTNASRRESGLHSTSAQRSPHTTWSQSVERCASGGTASGTTRGAAPLRSTTTRRSVLMAESPTNG
jgi:hypothetical protein